MSQNEKKVEKVSRYKNHQIEFLQIYFETQKQSNIMQHDDVNVVKMNVKNDSSR